jgi:hypothetical protein
VLMQYGKINQESCFHLSLEFVLKEILSNLIFQ